MFKGHGHWVNTLALSTEHALRTGAYDHTGSAPSDPEEAQAQALQRCGLWGVEGGVWGALLSPGLMPGVCRDPDPDPGLPSPSPRYQTATAGQPERMVSGSDDFTMFLWQPSASKQHVARMTGHMQLVNQVWGYLQFICERRVIPCGEREVPPYRGINHTHKARK